MAVPPIRYLVSFTGHVQGVGFRVTAVQQSRGLDVHGTVCNESDGSVTMDVEGSPSDLKELVRRIESVMSRKLDGTVIDTRNPIGRTGGVAIKK
ncbi:Acylphosphatase [Rubripirellula tenax]|uniref:acylphosphatase n=1 Tax=Rubripirellula tenax TaxID=2528015 RepID=A0A5C6FF57_9BACT|nr:acylphosphatase [Rubripirellula tenax]TWU60141.1 Acylphosphatase [Rubripirellula tenax]